MIDKIKSDFYKHSGLDPFESADYYSFFGYSKHTNFKRFLDKEKFYPEICCESYSKVNTRTRSSISFSRKLFMELCKINNCLVKEVDEICIDYYSTQSRKRIEYFTVNTKTFKSTSLNMYNVPCGQYYTYSLNTYNLAKDLLLCPYDLYKFCSVELKNHFKYLRASVTNQFSDYYEKIPYFHFDSTNYDLRNEFLALIKMVIERYEMSDMSKRLAEIYYNEIKKMLYKQIRIDHLKNEKVEKQRKHKEKKEFAPPQLLKDMYRKACKLYHPDKNPNGEEIFKIINKAYHESDYTTLRKYSSAT